MELPTHRLLGITLALLAVGVLAGCDADSESEVAATTVASSRDPTDDSEPEVAATTVASSRDPTDDSGAPLSPDCTLAGNVRAVVEQVATINESSSVASAEEARDALLTSVQELKAGSQVLRRVDVKALNEGLAEVASAVNSVSRAETAENAVSSLQGSARDLDGAIQEVEDHFGCSPETG